MFSISLRLETYKMERNTDKNGEKQNLRHAFMIFVLFNLIYINAFYLYEIS